MYINGINEKEYSDMLQSKRVRTPVALLRSLSELYSWENYEPLYSSSNGLNINVTILLQG